MHGRRCAKKKKKSVFYPGAIPLTQEPIREVLPVPYLEQLNLYNIDIDRYFHRGKSGTHKSSQCAYHTLQLIHRVKVTAHALCLHPV